MPEGPAGSPVPTGHEVGRRLIDKSQHQAVSVVGTALRTAGQPSAEGVATIEELTT
jgi:hypothetical protein